MRTEKRSTRCCVSMRADVRIAALAVVLAACKTAPPFDPQAAARAIVKECGTDAVCAHERWRRDPRAFGLGLRAEVAASEPQSPFVVETTREIASPGVVAACGVAPPGAVFDYRTSVTKRGSGEYALALFRWETYERALVGQRQVVALVSRARGDESAMWKALAADPALDRACLRFREQRDLCASGS